MVHALETVHRLLIPGGCLIDIHPAGESPPIFLRSAAQQIPIGWLGESDYFAEYRQADRAIAQEVAAGLFRLEDHREFIFETQAGDLVELAVFLKANWSDAVLEEGLIERASQLQSQAGGLTAVILSERVQILKLVPVIKD
jgi:hypothetical protein